MRIFSSVQDLQNAIAEQKNLGKTVGFVPTMGALHQGHLSLIKQCKVENDVCVVSIFVNPTQFNNKQDLASYPRTLDKDAKLLEPLGCDFIFAPSEKDMYSEEEVNKTFDFDFKGLDKVMEGKFRPGHFNGVVQIVSKLFSIVNPNKAYFGEKDFQQVAIIRHMTKSMAFPIEIIACPIIREESGLAMSSRNELLSVDERKNAVHISKVLNESRNFVSQKSPKALTEWVIEQVNSGNGLEVEYFEIVDGDSLQTIEKWEDTKYAVGCITVYCGKVRLIDNMRYL